MRNAQPGQPQERGGLWNAGRKMAEAYGGDSWFSAFLFSLLLLFYCFDLSYV